MGGGRTSRRFTQDHRNRRLTGWEPGPGGNDIGTLDLQVLTSSTTVIMGVGATPLVSGLTVVRIHGSMELSLSVAAVATDGFNWTAGIGVVTLDAFTAGVTSVPNPFDDATWPGWMWYAQGEIHTSVGALTIGDPSVNPVIVPIETKSMRKLPPNTVLCLVLQVGENGTASLRVAAQTRVLTKLP